MFDTTIIVPTNNRISMLRRAIESIAQQTILPYQIIIVNDFPKVKIKREDFIECTDLDIKIVNNEKNLGGSLCRNIGIKLAKTKYITFLDDDDAFCENYLEEIKNKLKDIDQENVALYGSKKFVLSSTLDNVFKKNISSTIVKCEDLFKNNIVGTTSCVTVSRKSLIEVDGFDSKLPAFQDFDCWLRLTLNGLSFYPVSEAFVYYTINVNSSQISGNFNNHIIARERMLYKFKDVLSNNLYNQLVVTLSFFVAKSIHRRKYFLSLKYTLPIITKKIFSIALLIPYKILNKFGIYTS
jgi:glycosyltransferase involved in cell wall biosynthesis